MTTSLVVDANLTFKFIMPGQTHEQVKPLFDQWETDGLTLVAPTLWVYEMTSLSVKEPSSVISVRFVVKCVNQMNCSSPEPEVTQSYYLAKLSCQCQGALGREGGNQANGRAAHYVTTDCFYTIGFTAQHNSRTLFGVCLSHKWKRNQLKIWKI